MDGPKFKVIIVGGSISGLSLAHCLHKAGIDSIVLEKRSEIAANEGASVAIMPNGGRILQQIGIFDTLGTLIEPTRVAHVRFPDGFQFSSPYPKTMREAFGFPMAFLQRRLLLRLLYDLYPDKSNIYVNRNVVNVDHQGSEGVIVYTQSGHSYQGDLLVGADGVHSQVRTLMWDVAERVQPGVITRDEKTGMTVSYACIFGISTAIPGLQIGNLHLSVYNGISFIVAPGSEGRISWFIVLKLDKTFQYGNAPRFTSADAASRCEQLTDMYVWNNTRFAKLWKNREVFSMTSLEENIFQTWHYGRIVCIGDSMHKMTPNLAQGANCSIEDAASLTNALVQLLGSCQHSHRPSNRQVDGILCKFNAMQFARMSEIYKASQIVVRLQTRENIFWKILLRYFVPYSGSYATERAMDILENAVFLRFVPLPQRSGNRWIQPKDKKTSTSRRPTFAVAFSLLVLILLLWYQTCAA